jgi:hypothetical protein
MTLTVHKRLLKMWRARLLCLWPARCVYRPPLSEANCPPLSPPGRPGPPASKMPSFSPGSTHTPSTLSVTLSVLSYSGRPVLTFLPWPSCPGSPVSLCCLCCHVLTLLFNLSCPGGPVSDTQSTWAQKLLSSRHVLLHHMQ